MNQHNAIPREKDIRDHLAQNLSLIEDGLILKQVEMKVENPDGADGFIDIFAEDRWNHKVVIELKRSDQAARQALHEVFKYTELLRRNSGLRDSQLRVIIVSTTWHELLIPFSACVKKAMFPVDGFNISVDDLGKTTNVKRVVPLKEGHLLDFIHDQGIFLYRHREERDTNVLVIAHALELMGAQDWVLFTLDYGGRNERVILPHAIYVALGTEDLEKIYNKSRQAGTWEEYESYLEDADESPFDFWQGHYASELFCKIVHCCDEYEIGYPEKAKGIRQDWILRDAKRSGRWFGTESIYSNEELWRWLSRLDGGNAIFFDRSTSPRFASEWQEVKASARYTMIGYQPWYEFYEAYLDEIESKYPNADVKILIYAHFDLLTALLFTVAKGDMRYLPSFEILVTDPISKKEHYVSSPIIWDGFTCPQDISAILCQFFKDPDDYLLHNILGTQYKYFEQLLLAHGFTMPMLEVERGEGIEKYSKITVDNGELNRIEHSQNDTSGMTLEVFIKRNVKYCLSLIEYFEMHSDGLI